MVKSKENLIVAYAFLIGVILAVILGLSTRYVRPNNFFYILLVILGVVIGYLNSGDKDSINFLFAIVSLVIVSGLGNSTLVFISQLSPVLDVLNNVLRSLLVLFIPATIIVALKVVFSMAKV